MSNKSFFQRPEMTSKEALAVLQKVYRAGGINIFSPDASEEAKALREQVHTAFHILATSIHGRKARYAPFCDFCYLRFSERLYIWVKGDYMSRPCCTTCKEQLEAAQKLAYVGDRPLEAVQTIAYEIVQKLTYVEDRSQEEGGAW